MNDGKARELIMEAAALLVQEGQAEQLTLAHVAEAAHMAEADVSRQFPTMDDLVAAMAWRLSDTFFNAVAEACGDDETPGAWMRAYVETGLALDETGDRSRIARALLGSTAYRRHVLDAFREREDDVQDFFYDSGVATDAVVVIRAAISGIFFGRMFGLDMLPAGTCEAVRARLLSMTRAAA